METKQQKEDLEAWAQDLSGFKSQLLHLQAVGLHCDSSLKFCVPSFLICKTEMRKERTGSGRHTRNPSIREATVQGQPRFPQQMSGLSETAQQDCLKIKRRGGGGDGSGKSELPKAIQRMQWSTLYKTFHSEQSI